VNAVGYVNVTLAADKFTMIANPLDNKGTGGNTISNLFQNVPEGTTIYKFDNASGSYSINTFEFGEWANGGDTLAPGDGAFIKTPAGSDVTVTFVGEVMQGALSNPIPAGFSIKSSQVPQSGQLDTDLGFPAAEGDIIYLFDPAAGTYSIHAYEFGEWSIAPVPAVGEAFFVSKTAAASWTRTFDINAP
jgi:hypothetical protein